jgi:4-diphosphocytidyl-2-C-methyl-D-erythritol kinase
MNRRPAAAKINLALVVGPPRDDGKHEVTTVYQRIALADRVALEAAPTLRVSGFDGDTLVRDALQALASEAGVHARWAARIEKRLPVAAGLGGGSSDAATALRLANATLSEPLDPPRLERVAASLGADVPYFLRNGPQLGTGDGSDLEPLDLPQDYWIVLLLPNGAVKGSTAEVYRDFDEREGPLGYDERRRALLDALAAVRRPRDLAALPPNDLASSPLAEELTRLGAFRADVSGAGPTVYALFLHRAPAEAAERALRHRGRTWITVPAWYV